MSNLLEIENKNFYFELLIRKKKKTKFWFRNRSGFLYWNEIYNSELFEKNVGMLGFLILDVDLALYRYCLWSWDYSAYALRYAIVFFEKKPSLLDCFVVIKYAVFL